MSPINSTTEQARDDGVDTREVVRAGLVELRNAMLTIARFDEVVLLSHAIWWLAPDDDKPGPQPMRVTVR